MKSAGTPAGESHKVILGDTAGGSKNIIYHCSNGQAANGVGKSDSEACERALINAARKFQQAAGKLGGRGVTGFHSYFDKQPLQGGQYDCQAGSFHVRVVMRANVVR